MFRQHLSQSVSSAGVVCCMLRRILMPGNIIPLEKNAITAVCVLVPAE